MGAPPVRTGAPKLTLIPPGTLFAATLVGAVGRPSGTREPTRPSTLSPTALVASKPMVYCVPLVSPLMTIGLAVPFTLRTTGSFSVAPWCAMAVYRVTGRPPSSAGGLNDTVTWESPPATDSLVGELGAKIVVTRFEGPDSALLPCALFA